MSQTQGKRISATVERNGHDDAARARGLDDVREILFGGTAREIDERLARMADSVRELEGRLERAHAAIEELRRAAVLRDDAAGVLVRLAAELGKARSPRALPLEEKPC